MVRENNLYNSINWAKFIVVLVVLSFSQSCYKTKSTIATITVLNNSNNSPVSGATVRLFYEDPTGVNTSIIDEQNTTSDIGVVHFDFSEYLNYEIIKEPYLLFVLSSIVKYVDKLILIIRNPKEVKESWINFIKINNGGNLTPGMTDKYIYDKWEKYYVTFLENILENNFDNYHIVNYNNIGNRNSEINNSEIEKLSKFLEISNNSHKLEINFKNNCNFDDLSGCPATTKYLYISILNSNKSNKSTKSTKSTIENYYKLKQNGIKPNEKCICNSGKKYKKCCNF